MANIKRRQEADCTRWWPEEASPHEAEGYAQCRAKASFSGTLAASGTVFSTRDYSHRDRFADARIDLHNRVAATLIAHVLGSPAVHFSKLGGRDYMANQPDMA